MQLDYRKYNYNLILYFDKVWIHLFKKENKNCTIEKSKDINYTLLVYLKDNNFGHESIVPILYFDENNELKTFNKKQYYKIEFNNYLEMKNYIKKYGIIKKFTLIIKNNIIHPKHLEELIFNYNKKYNAT